MFNLSDHLFHYIIRLNKVDSAFFYFQLEANDGLCFYSTLFYEPHCQYRDLDLKGDIRLENEIIQVIEQCQKKIKIDILLKETIPNQKSLI